MTTRICYESVALCDPSQEILSIARSAERWNREEGCSGLLFYDASTFFQVLEGPDASVKDVYSRIALDRRHRILGYTEVGVKSRLVADHLAMGYVSNFELQRLGLRLPTNADPDSFVRSVVIEALASKYPSALSRQLAGIVNSEPKSS